MTTENIKEDTIGYTAIFFISTRFFKVRDTIKALENDNNDEILLRNLIREAYYVTFQFISYFCTESLVQSETNDIASNDWVKIFRSFNHKDVRSGLDKFSKDKTNKKIVEIQNIAEFFAKLQDERMKADYDPRPYSLGFLESKVLIDNALRTVVALRQLSLSDKRSLAITLLFKDRP